MQTFTEELLGTTPVLHIAALLQLPFPPTQLVVVPVQLVAPAETIGVLTAAVLLARLKSSWSSVTEALSLRLIPDSIRRVCLEKGIISKSLLLQVARQPNEKKMREMTQRIAQGGLTRDEARRARKDETESVPRPQPFVFHHQAEDGAFRLRLEFRKSHVSQEELAAVLRAVLRQIETRSSGNTPGSDSFSTSAA
jgi:hypothetical protein